MMELNELTDFGWTTYRAAKELSGWFDETGGVSGGCATFEWADVEGIAEVRAYIALVNGESA